MHITSDLLNEKHPLKNTGYYNTEGAVGQPRHNWYYVKEAFSPQIVDKAIEETKLKGEGIIVDPFCGSGTVPLTGSLKGFRSVGIEVNPFLAFVSKTKLIQCRPQIIDNTISKIITKANIGKVSPLEGYSSFSQAGGAKKWLFNEAILRCFEGGWDATNSLPSPVRNLFRLMLIGAAMDTCNATKDGKCLRYRDKWQELSLGTDQFLSALEVRAKMISSDLLNCKSNTNLANIQIADSRITLRRTLEEKFKLCVTSPPYLNSFDYSDVYRPEMFLGKFVQSNDDLSEIRYKTLRSHVQVKWKLPKTDNFGPLYKAVVEKINERKEELWNKKIPTMIQAYFEDIERVLLNLRAMAQPKANLWLVVSTSAYVGIEVPVDLIIAYIGSNVGWRLKEIGVLRNLRTAGQHHSKKKDGLQQITRLRESLVVFEAS
jgi:hypothetical protein